MVARDRVSPMNINSVTPETISQMFQSMEARLADLQQQVQSLQLQLRQERSERHAFQQRVGKKVRSVLTNLFEDDVSASEDLPLEEDHMNDFDEVRAILDAADNRSRSNPRLPNQTPNATPSEQDTSPEDMLSSFVGGQRSGIVTLAELAENANSQVDSSHQTATLPSLVLKDIDQNSSHNEDIATLINDAMAQNIRKRTLSNEFLLSQPQRSKTRNISGIDPSMSLTPISHPRNIPIIPLRLNTPASLSNAPPTPSGQLSESDILEKWGVRFSEKYNNIWEMWNEYQKVGEKGVSIKSLELSFSNRWRTNLRKNVKKKYSRRFIVIRAIETGIKRGKTVEECIEFLENFLKSNSKPISHLYRKANVPQELT
ncbi:LAFE_0F05424g1_1 [Lachancea fermentati]|uniref:LAFE_0F05424g1_1 n=1 Tax=Lachancea fermentati TaxID=4955 RepID=A0A1G4MEN6_LACFM|nr:LAFE_0F05424g1_1 [Lachancea fermentati]